MNDVTDPESGAARAAAPISAPEVSLADALDLLARVRAAAHRDGLRLAYVIVDSGGNPVVTARDDGTQLGALSLAGDKAYTAVAFGMPTSAWTESSRPGGGDWGIAGTLGGRAIVFPGGVPLFVAGRLVGAVGVSGTVSTDDERCALAGIESSVFGHPA